MLTSRPSGDGYNPVINAMRVEPFNYSTWHKIFLYVVSRVNRRTHRIYTGAFYAKELGIKACLAVTARRGWHKIFPLCSKAKIAVLCHCMYDHGNSIARIYLDTNSD